MFQTGMKKNLTDFHFSNIILATLVGRWELREMWGGTGWSGWKVLMVCRWRMMAAWTIRQTRCGIEMNTDKIHFVALNPGDLLRVKPKRQIRIFQVSRYFKKKKHQSQRARNQRENNIWRPERNSVWSLRRENDSKVGGEAQARSYRTVLGNSDCPCLGFWSGLYLGFSGGDEIVGNAEERQHLKAH